MDALESLAHREFGVSLRSRTPSFSLAGQLFQGLLVVLRRRLHTPQRSPRGG
jgi:hypothetical protein